MPSPPPGARTIVSKHPNSIRLFVLETDEPHRDTKNEVGTFGDVLNKLFQRAGDSHDPSLGVETVMQYVVEQDGGRVPEPEEITDDIHAILITGSCYDAHGDEEWIHKLMGLIRHIWIHRPDIKFCGICFGHQILCRTLGSKIEPNENGAWELSHTAITLTDVGRKLFNIESPSSSSSSSTKSSSSQKDDDDDESAKIHLHEMHLDHVAVAPSHKTTELLSPDTKAHVWGHSSHTGIQGIYICKRVFTTQGHMEFNEENVRRQLEMRVEAGSLDEKDADEASERADMMHDGEVVAKAVLRFFHGDDDVVE